MFRTIIILISLLATPAFAQRSCDFGVPNPDAPDEINQFGFLIGNFRIESRIWQGDAFSEGYLPAEWNGRWGIDGWAIIDEWFGPQIGENPQTFGVNVRTYNPETESWSMVWQATSGSSMILGAEQGEDGVLRMWQTTPEPTQERYIYFEIYDDTHWARIDGIIGEDGARVPKFRIDAYREPCE